MWRCSNCGTGIEDKYAHCWQCGAKNVLDRNRPKPPVSEKAAPEFASYEELAKVPGRPPWILRRGPLQRLCITFAFLILFKVASAPFIGAYGLYIVIASAVVSLVIILWGHFRRDPSEGVGIKLN